MPKAWGWSEDNASLTVIRGQRNQPSDGVDVIDRTQSNSNSLSFGAIGNLRMTSFTPTKDMTVANVWASCGAVAANYGTATGLVVRMGLYSADVATNNQTLLASTTHDATLFTVASTVYKKALNTSVTLTAGSRYSVALIIYNSGGTITTLPQFSGINGYSQINAESPRIAHLWSSQTDLPSSITGASGGPSGTTIWFRLVA